MSFKNAHPGRYFTKTYKDGRQKFLNSCVNRKLAVHSILLPNYKGPHGEDLAMDCVWVGARDAQSVLLITCGTHGLEAATGAATILQLLDSDICGNLQPDTALLIVHAVNPYGWAHNRRGNEDGIDLNRNCMDHGQPHPENTSYLDLHDIIKNASVSTSGLENFTEAFHAYGKFHGMSQAINGITAGQYTHPNGMSYGGQTLSWSCKTLFDVARRFLNHAQRIIHIDWHTGIGDFGKPFFIIDDPAPSQEYHLASKWWPAHTIHADDILEGGSPNYTGLLVRGLKEKIESINQAKIVSVVVEWGTYDLDNMLQALLMDDWLKDRRLSGEPIIQTARNQLVERFNPASPRWRQAVLKQAPSIYQQALSGLKSW